MRSRNMSSLFGLLATKNIYHQIPTYVLIVCGMILLVAFTVGFVKGFRKVAWGGFYWLLAFVGFTVAYDRLASKNPIASLMKGQLEGATSFAWALLLMLGAVAISLILYAAFSFKYRPKEVPAPRECEVEVDEYGFVYEDEREDDCPYCEKPVYVMVGDGKPTLFGRIAGGFMSCVNVAAVLVSIIAVTLIFIGQTKLVYDSIGDMFDVPLTRKALDFASAYAFDFFTIGLVIWIAYVGFKTGFVRSFRVAITAFGILVIGDIGFALPFTKAANYWPIENLIDRCGLLFTQMKPEYRTILSKLVAGGVLALAGFVSLFVLSFLLRKAVDQIESHMTTLVIDEILAVVMYLIFGALAVATLWAALYLLDYCGILFVSDAFGEGASLAKEFFEVAEHYLKDFAENSLLKFRVK